MESGADAGIYKQWCPHDALWRVVAYRTGRWRNSGDLQIIRVMKHKIFLIFVLMMLLAACSSGQVPVQVNVAVTQSPLQHSAEVESGSQAVALPATAPA